jgi:hypothetical protein
MTKQISTTTQYLNDTVGAAFDAAPLPAAGVARKSEIVALEPTYVSRDMFAVWLRYTGAGAAGAPHVRMRISAKATVPADDTDDSWHDVAVTDGTVTASTAFAGGPAVMGQVLVQGDLVRLPPTGVAAVNAQCVHVRAPAARWLYVEAAEIGNVGAPGILRVGLSCT